jgi:DNA-binding response OmpR family regulator
MPRNMTMQAGSDDDAPGGRPVGGVSDAPLVVAVDDDETVLALVERVLAAYRVVSFERPDAALAALRAGLRPDLILSDVQMPGMSGFELHVELRRLAPLRSVPFVYLTALDRRDDVRRGMGLGADDYLTKPILPSELRQAVEVRLERSRALQAAEPEPDGLVLRTLGALTLSYGELRLSWEAKRVVLLLAYLLEEDGAAPAGRVRADLLEPGAGPNHLHVLVSRLRKTLGDLASVTVIDEEVRLALTTPVAWDAATFGRLARRALDAGGFEGVEAALALYAGPSLDAFDGPWVDFHRATLEDLYMELLEAAVERAPDAPARQRAEQRLARVLEA